MTHSGWLISQGLSHYTLNVTASVYETWFGASKELRCLRHKVHSEAYLYFSSEFHMITWFDSLISLPWSLTETILHKKLPTGCRKTPWNRAQVRSSEGEVRSSEASQNLLRPSQQEVRSSVRASVSHFRQTIPGSLEQSEGSLEQTNPKTSSLKLTQSSLERRGFYLAFQQIVACSLKRPPGSLEQTAHWLFCPVQNFCIF